MSALPHAMATGATDPVLLAQSLLHMLQQELEAQRAERELYKELDAASILERAREREVFTSTIARIHSQLAFLLQQQPERTPRLRDLLSRIRKASADLARQQQLNDRLARRTLDCVGGYLRAVAPTTTAYDRRGARRLHAVAKSHSANSRLSRKV